MNPSRPLTVPQRSGQRSLLWQESECHWASRAPQGQDLSTDTRWTTRNNPRKYPNYPRIKNRHKLGGTVIVMNTHVVISWIFYLKMLLDYPFISLFSLGAFVYKHDVSSTSTYNELCWCVRYKYNKYSPFARARLSAAHALGRNRSRILLCSVFGLGFFEAPHSPSKPASKTSQKMRSNLGKVKAVLTCQDKNASKTHDTQQDMKVTSNVIQTM